MKKALILFLVILILAGLASLAGYGGGGDNGPIPALTKRMVCVQTSNEIPRCFDVPAYPTLAPYP